ncbi:putative reverse transcriptase domain, fatty acid desaturase domain, acyl-CoA desaturase [Helianthus anomalus]
MRNLNTGSQGVKASEYRKIPFSDVKVTGRRNLFMGRKWRTVDVKIAVGMLGVHMLALFAPFTFTWGAFWAGFTTYLLCGMFGITLSYHRNLAHHSFKLPKWLEYIFAYLGVLSLQRDPIFWVSMHRYHHQFVDSEKDPHSPIFGFWFSHMGWIFDSGYIFEKYQERKNVEDLKNQAFYRIKLELWGGQSLPFERVAWLKIHGVPLHILDSDTLARTGEMFGKVLHVPRPSEVDQDLSIFRVGILVGDSVRIREVVSLKWKDRVYRVWVEEESEDFIPDCVQGTSVASMDEASPLQSSPIAQVPGSRNFESEGSRKVEGQDRGVESSLSGDSVDLGKRNNFNQEAADGVPEVGTISKDGGVGSNKIFFFESRKRQRRFKKYKVGRAQSFVEKSGGGDFLDSSEKGRPIKRSRAQVLDFDTVHHAAQVSVSSDPFSLNRLLEQVGNDKEIGSDAHRPAASPQGIFVSRTNGIPFDLNDKASSKISNGSESRRSADDSPEENEAMDNSSAVDLEVEATVKLGNQLGMDLGACEGLVKNVILGKGGDEKARWIKGIKVKFGLSFLALQESKSSPRSSLDLVSFWGGKNFEAEWVDPSGLSGGLISIWDPNVFSFVEAIKDPNFLIVKGKLKGSGQILNIGNVYGPQDLIQKRQLWEKLRYCIEGSEGMWILLGDFNAVRIPEEKCNARFNPRCAGLFNDFIYNCGFLEYGMKDRKFTWQSSNGKKLSKIDRLLVCKEFFDLWPEACLRALPKFLSDHCPLVLVTKDNNYGPKPFRVFDSWIGRSGFEEVVRNAASSFVFEGPADLYLLKKFEHIRSNVKKWRDLMLKKEGELESKARQEMEDLELVMESGELTEEEEWILTENLKLIKEVEENKSKDIRQRSRVKWAKDGDENSRFFHSMVNCRKANNRIHGLRINGNWCSKPSIVKKSVFSFFRDKFKEELVSRPEVVCDNFKRLTSAEAADLIGVFCKEELKSAVSECGSDRAPGPDGFNFRFLKHFWDLFENDFFRILNEFYLNGSVSRGCAAAFIALIPKVTDPIGLNDFRPISLVGAINKVISKVLANRLKKVLGSVISESQSAFLRAKFILDGPLIINEVINWLKKNKKTAFIMKLDFEKAYDNVNWGFIMSVMRQMGFPPLWCKWVFGVLSSARSAVLVNGAPTFDFECQKGMRQGDPLSPFLFLLVMEALSGCLDKAIGLGSISGVHLPNGGPVLSHLFYADDALIIGNWSEENVLNVVRILRGFYICSGLRINLEKSNIFGIGVSASDSDRLASLVGCKSSQIPFVYLGLPVGANMNRIANWRPVFDIFESRLSLWKAAVLSIGGRVTLIKSVLGSLPNYFFSLYKAPVGVINKLEAIIRKFLWGGSGGDKKLSWVAWDRVASPIDCGGLGIRSLDSINRSLLLKWGWRFKVDNDSLWVKVISAIHECKNRWGFLPVKTSLGGVWRSIAKLASCPIAAGVGLRDLMKGTVGNGSSIAFWLDPWLCDIPLKECFPNLFRLEKDKKCAVRDRIVRPVSNPRACWNWKQLPNSNIELAEWMDLNIKLREVSLSVEKDKWSWLGDSSGVFSVGSVKRLLDRDKDFSSRYVWDWCKWVPLKCNLFAWRAELDRLPSKVELIKRNISLPDDVCPLCGTDQETTLHLFTACQFSMEVWMKITRWCKVPDLVAFSVRDILEFPDFCGLNGWRLLAVKGILIITCWLIWKARNDHVFGNKASSVQEVWFGRPSVLGCAGRLMKFSFQKKIKRTYILHPFGFATLIYVFGGFTYLVWVMGVVATLGYHMTFLVNSACHIWGNQTWNTGDLSKNNWWVALVTFGEGWHNNHHAFEYSARHGLEWWQIDFCWYMIRLLEAIGLATNVKLPTEDHKLKKSFASSLNK